jgi:hypothetical protein
MVPGMIEYLVQLYDVHGGHGETSAIHHAANVAGHPHVVQVPFRRSNLQMTTQLLAQSTTDR